MGNPGLALESRLGDIPLDAFVSALLALTPYDLNVIAKPALANTAASSESTIDHYPNVAAWFGSVWEMLR